VCADVEVTCAVSSLLLLVMLGCGCATRPPDLAGVRVYEASLDAVAAQRAMTSGCRLVKTTKKTSMTELDMTGQKDPLYVQRRDANRAGGNALLVLSRQVISRHDPECPGASPVTDCPPGSGAWFDVVFETYACTLDALDKLRNTAKQ
jgi:hypothetical protein